MYLVGILTSSMPATLRKATTNQPKARVSMINPSWQEPIVSQTGWTHFDLSAPDSGSDIAPRLIMMMNMSDRKYIQLIVHALEPPTWNDGMGGQHTHGLGPPHPQEKSDSQTPQNKGNSAPLAAHRDPKSR